MECVYCDSPATKKLNTFADYSVCRCEVCGTLFTDVSADSKDFFYDSPPSPRQSFVRRILSNVFKRINADFYFEYLLNHVDLDQISSVLEVGADRGHFIRLFEKRGMRTLGLEADRIRAVSPVSKNLRIAFFDQHFNSEEKFDLICLTGVMLFFRDNRSIIKKAYSLLNDEGYIFLFNINADSLSAIKHFSLKGNPHNCACILSRKGWTDMSKQLGLRLVDYSCYEPPMMKAIGDHKWLKLPKYVLFPSSSYYKTDANNGHYNFIIFKKE